MATAKKHKHKRSSGPVTIARKEYLKELRRLQVELVQLEEWIRHRNLRVVVIFEGRDTAGKGGVIKRIMALLNPRYCRVVALPAPTERVWSESWASAPMPNTRSSCVHAPSSSECSCARGSS